MFFILLFEFNIPYNNVYNKHLNVSIIYQHFVDDDRFFLAEKTTLVNG
jgi:hypothetical protein